MSEPARLQPPRRAVEARAVKEDDGRPGRIVDILGIGMPSMFLMMSSASSPGNSFSPVNSSNITEAAENRSLRVSSVSPRACSGDM